MRFEIRFESVLASLAHLAKPAKPSEPRAHGIYTSHFISFLLKTFKSLVNNNPKCHVRLKIDWKTEKDEGDYGRETDTRTTVDERDDGREKRRRGEEILCH